MSLTQTQLSSAVGQARMLPFNAPRVSVEAFYASALGLNPAQQFAAFPDPDPAGLLAIATASLTQDREKTLQVNCDVPSFVVYEDPTGVTSIAGLGTYLTERGMAPATVGRFEHRALIRDRLRTLTKGQQLEAVAAAIMAAACGGGVATRGSGDQGLDAFGWKGLVAIDGAFANGGVTSSYVPVGERVYLLASSKAAISSTATTTPLISPAHVRELVGGWVIHRSPAGIWANLGIKMLTPLQMILITTYRLSSDAKALCNDLGVQVWGVPELVYLICMHAPASVFSAMAPFALDSTAFRMWWKVSEAARVRPSASVF